MEPQPPKVFISHASEDKVYVVLEGEAVFDIGGDQELLIEGSAVMARAGVAHGVRNDSDSPVVLLVVMAPKPQPEKLQHEKPKA